MNSDDKKYDDIINLPHHVSKKHKQMSLDARSAQFAPFSALTGYDDVIEETVRLTNEKIEIDENIKIVLDEKLQIIEEKIAEKPLITFIYFVPDLKKDGGMYLKITGKVKRIDKYKHIIILEDKTEIPIADVAEINGKIFDEEGNLKK